jgi:hypothetical protein
MLTWQLCWNSNKCRRHTACISAGGMGGCRADVQGNISAACKEDSRVQYFGEMPLRQPSEQQGGMYAGCAFNIAASRNTDCVAHQKTPPRSKTAPSWQVRQPLLHQDANKLSRRPSFFPLASTVRQLSRSHLQLCLLLFTQCAVLAEVDGAARYTGGGAPRQYNQPCEGATSEKACHLCGAHEQGGEEPVVWVWVETRQGGGKLVSWEAETHWLGKLPMCTMVWRV